MVGRWGSFKFKVSDEKVMTFRDMNYKKSARTAESESYGAKPTLTYLGPALDEVTLSIDLVAELGVDPKAEANRLWKRAGNGTVAYLYIGDWRVGKGKWLIESINSEIDHVMKNGAIGKVTLSVTLIEYV